MERVGDRAIGSKKEKYYVELQTVTFYPGVESLLAELKALEIPFPTATTGHLDQLCLTVPQSFFSNFNGLVTGDMFSRSKADPEPYITGALKLGLRIEDYIAVENAPTGIPSAHHANIFCIGTCSSVGPKELAQAHEVVIRFEDLRETNVIKKILNAGRSYA
jgi:beta-phosphoglucomutase-like phosphatase (HAD superfamily)